MSGASRIAAPGAAALAGRAADALAAVVDAVLDALRGGIVGQGTAPVLRPIPVRARHGRTARDR